MSGRHVPRTVLPCDFCKAALAPFGYAPAPRLGIKVRRSIWTCAAPACKAQAEARVAALAARHGPLTDQRQARPAAAQPAPRRKPVQGRLF